MRGAFIVRLGPETQTSPRVLDGWVEEVDSGIELRFHSADELLGFLGDRFDVAFGFRSERLHPSAKSSRDGDAT